MIRQVNFDFDGVLLNACDIHYHALNKALPKEAQICPLEHHLKFNGLPTKTKLEILLSEGRISKDKIIQIKVAKQKYTEEELNKFTTDWSKVRLMQRLYEDDIRICCVSNAVRKTIKLGLDKIGVIDYFDFIVSNENCKKQKPDPEPYLLAMNRFGFYRQQNLIVEDSSVGLESARKGGFQHILQVNNATEVTADTVLRKIREINEICL